MSPRERGPDGSVRRTGLRRTVALWRWWIARWRPLDLIYRGLVGVVGASIIAVGLVAVPLPGPGWLTVIAGLLVLATEFRWAERHLQFTKRHVKAWTTWLAQQPAWSRLLLAGATTTFGYGLVVITLHLLGVPQWVPAWIPLWR